MKKNLEKLLDNFITKPTEDNLEELNIQARQYISYWIESMHSGKKLSNSEKKPKNKTSYKTIEPKDFSIPEDARDGHWYTKLQKKDDGVSDPFIVISIRSIFYSRKSKRNHNRRFYRMGQDNWYAEQDQGVDQFIGMLNEGWFEYEDHRRNKDIPFADQFIHSRDLTEKEKWSYLEEFADPEDGFASNYVKEGFFDNSDIEFCIDAYAGDASGDSDGSNWRKILIKHSETGQFTIRSTTTDQNYRPSKQLWHSSEWRLDNSMPDVSPQTAKLFFEEYVS